MPKTIGYMIQVARTLWRAYPKDRLLVSYWYNRYQPIEDET